MPTGSEAVAVTGSQVSSGVLGTVELIVFLAVVVAVSMGWSHLKRVAGARMREAARRASEARGELLEGSDRAAIASTRPAAGLAAIRGHDHGFDEQEFLSGVEQSLIRLTDAMAQQRADEVRPLVADRLFATYSTMIEAMQRRRIQATADRIRFADVRIVGAHGDARYDTITVRVAQLVEGTMGRAGRKARQSRSADLRDAIFQRSAQAERRPDGGLLAMRCPSCQAPLTVDAQGRCSYCHTLVMNGTLDWVMVRWEIPGEGVGPPPTEAERSAVVEGARLAPLQAPRGIVDQLTLADTVVVNQRGELTPGQRHATLREARSGMYDAVGHALGAAAGLLVTVAASLLLARYMSQSEDPWSRSVTIGGTTRTLPLLHLAVAAAAVVCALNLLRRLAVLAVGVRRWSRAHGPARTVDGRVVFVRGAYHADWGPSPRYLVPWQNVPMAPTSSTDHSALTGILPGPYRLALSPGDRLLSLQATGDEPTVLRLLGEALAEAAGHGAGALAGAQTRVAAGDPTIRVVEGYVQPVHASSRGGAALVLRDLRLEVSEAAAAALVEGVWYRVYLGGDPASLIAIEPLPAERATSAAVDPQTVRGGLEAITGHDAGFDEATFLARVSRTFTLVHDAWCHLDAAVSRGVMSDTMWSGYARQIADLTARGWRPVLEGLTVTDTVIRSAERTAEWDTIVVRVGARGADYDVAADGGGGVRIVRGDRTVRSWREDWVFHRAATASTPTEGGTLAQRCPNCQAPLQLDAAGVCGYCHAPIMTGAIDWVLIRIDEVAAGGDAAAPGLAQLAPAAAPPSGGPHAEGHP